MRLILFVALATVITLTSPAWGAKLQGKVVVSKGLVESLAEQEREEADAQRAYYWNEPNGMIPVRPPAVRPNSDLAMVLVKEGAAAPTPDELTTVKVRAASLERNVVVTRPGSTIRFRNVGPFDHELYSPGMPGFKPERQSRDAFRPIEFAKEGIFEVRCQLQPHFRGYVVVTNATTVVPMRKDGTFSIDELEPGKYTIKVFHRGSWIHEQKFEVAEDKREVQVEVKLASPGAASSPPAGAAEKDAKPEG